MMKTIARLWIGIGILAVLSPLGLYLPKKFNAGSAWGEWGADEMGGLIGYIPAGLKKISSFWNAFMPDYAFRGWEEKGSGQLSFAYVLSAVAGIALCAGLTYLLSRNYSGKKNKVVSKEK